MKERDARETPFIDKTLYTSVNGMLISVFLQGYRILGDKSLRDFAVRSLDRIMKSFFVDNKLFHGEGIPAQLDDYVYLIDALTAAYEVTADKYYLDRADELMGLCIDRLWDRDEGGFFDTDEHLLDLKIKEIEDIPRPSANSLCIRLLLKLHFITGKEIYHEFAGNALKAFHPKAKGIGVHAGYYFSSLDAYFNTLKIDLYSEPGSKLSETAVSLFGLSTCIIYGEDRGHAIACMKDVCHEPLASPESLKDFFNKKKFLGNHQI